MSKKWDRIVKAPLEITVEKLVYVTPKSSGHQIRLEALNRSSIPANLQRGPLDAVDIIATQAFCECLVPTVSQLFHFQYAGQIQYFLFP